MRAKKVITVAAVVVVVGALVADRGSKLALERVAAGRLQHSLETSARPSVDLGGFPFLQELIERKFDHVTVDIVGAGGGKVTVAHIHADLHGLTQQGKGLHADSISGDGSITYDALTAAAAPLQVSYGGDGLIRVTAQVTLLGRALSASASGRPRIEGNTLIVKPERAATSVTGDAGQAASEVPEVQVPLRNMPPNLKIVLNPTAAGVDFTFSGSDVSLTANSSTTGSSAPAPSAIWPPAVPDRRLALGRPAAAG
ncbi:MAG TPA: DUF2993 domain-containing protein [Sporichthyaceae bacterium]|jgi:hypothetical protein|nr:DUF2993 domain-containing protein [Sporichthyaceae bacterium]